LFGPPEGREPSVSAEFPISTDKVLPSLGEVGRGRQSRHNSFGYALSQPAQLLGYAQYY
jgi:hypothetical protein